MLNNLGYQISADDFFDYCEKATQAREKVKFEFTKNLSLALDNLVLFGKEVGIKRKQMAFLTCSDLAAFSQGAINYNEIIKLIKWRKKNRLVAKMIELPQLILAQQDFLGFERNLSEPNFVTSKSIEADSVCFNDDGVDIGGKIVFIEQADPGYDWMFAHDLAGLITKYGGANSHMAIRSAELNLPAAIGIGDHMFDELSSASIIRLNCGLKQIIKVKS